MTQTARVPAPEPVSDILREVPRLKVSESSGRRVACRFALYDLRRWCVRHAIAVLAGVCRTGSPVAFRNPASVAALSRPIPERRCACDGVYGSVRFLYGSVRFLYGGVRFFVRRCTVFHTAVYGFRMDPSDLGRTHPNDPVTQKMTNGVPCQPVGKVSHSAAKIFSPSPAHGGCPPEFQEALLPTITACRTRSTAGRHADDGFARQQQLERHRTRASQVLSTLPACCSGPAPQPFESIGDSPLARLPCMDDDRLEFAADSVYGPLSGAPCLRKPM